MSDPIGLSIRVVCTLKLVGDDKVSDDSVDTLLDGLLSEAFSTVYKNKSIQEILIYALHTFKPLPSVNRTRTYEWGDGTIITQYYWNALLSTTTSVARTREVAHYPVEKLANTAGKQIKMTFDLQTTITPLYKTVDAIKETTSYGVIYPSLVVPDIVQKYRLKHSQRASAAMFKPDFKEQKQP